MNATPYVYTPDGTASSPLSLGGIPVQNVEGHVDLTASYYSLNVSTGKSYEIALTGVSDNVDLYVYDDIAMLTPICTSTTSGVVDESCIANNVSVNTLYIKVDGSTSSWGGRYDITALSYYVSEGSSAAPLDITGQTPYNGAVSKSANLIEGSYYRITGLTAGGTYTITLSNASDSSLRGQVMSDATVYTSVYPSCTLTSSNSYSCSFTLAAGVTEVFVQTNGLLTLSGSSYTIDIQ